MSIEALPNELLVKIFSHLSWEDWWLVNQRRNQVNGQMADDRTPSSDMLPNLSLVNRRWNQVIGHRATLNMSKYILQGQPGFEHFENVCIPLEVLSSSSREYSKFSCSLHSMDLLMMSGTFGAVLEYCHQRWNMNALHIKSGYDQFILFLQHHKHILNDVVRAEISVYDNHPTRRSFDGGAPCDTHFVLPMEKLHHLNMDYSASSFCSLSFHAPMLKILAVNQGVRDKLHLIFPESTKLRSVRYMSNRNWTKFPEGQTSKTMRLEFIDCAIATTLSAMFGNLQKISLNDVTITPTDEALECLNLTKLTFIDVKLQKPLKLRVPQLHTLKSDSESLRSLHLQDAIKADLLVIDLAPSYAQNFPVGLSSFRRLHLLPLDFGPCNVTSICWLWPYLSGITELQACSDSLYHTFHELRNMWKHIPRLNSLSVLGMEVPDNFNFLPINVQNVSIEGCETKGSSIEFPPSVQRVRVEKLRKNTEDASSAGMILLPPNRYSPLELVQEKIVWMVYSTKDCHDMENINPPRINPFYNVHIMAYTR